MMDKKFFSGIFSIIITFVSLLLSLKMLLKNSQLTTDDKTTALRYTWYGYLIIAAGFFIISFQELVAKFGFGYQILLLSLEAVSAYLAIWTAKNIKPSGETKKTDTPVGGTKKKRNYLFYIIITIFLLIFGVIFLLNTNDDLSALFGYAKQNTATQNTQTDMKSKVSWKTYSNQQMGFSIKIPEKVLSNYIDEKSLVNLNVFEDKKSVYFTIYSREETLKNNSWEFRISGTTVKGDKEVLPALDSIYYGMQGCKVEFNKDKDSEFFYLSLYPKNSSLQLDDPSACFISGKLITIYDKISGKLITYQLGEPFFYEAGGAVDGESLASLKFIP